MVYRASYWASLAILAAWTLVTGTAWLKAFFDEGAELKQPGPHASFVNNTIKVKEKNAPTLNATKKTHVFKDQMLPCTLRSRPAPMILMSLGRSGTGSMYDVLSKLSGGRERPRIPELTGGGTAKSKTFFRKIIPSGDVNGDWLIRFMCNMQRNYPDAGMVGFKWKPYSTMFEEKKATEGLELLGRLNPRIKVIRSRRNPLDVIISRYKHTLSKEEHGKKGKIRAHCRQGDEGFEECLKSQLKAGTGISLPTRRLLSKLQELEVQEKRVDDLLETMNVPTISVTEWTRIFRYLGVGPTELTARDVKEASHVATSNKFHNLTLSNYEEVASILRGTKFSKLLH
ncbi:hypothetical protein ACHAWF_011410 [Thalassiosira exigua]